MKTTVNFTAFADAFEAQGRGDNFSREGLQELFDYLEEYEESTGEQIELDVIAICCDYSEYSIQEAIDYFGLTVDALGLSDELEGLREAVVDDRMGAVNERLDEDMEAVLREQYEEEAQSLGLAELIEEEEDAVKSALLEYFGEQSQVIDIPNSDRLVLLAY